MRTRMRTASYAVRKQSNESSAPKSISIEFNVRFLFRVSVCLRSMVRTSFDFIGQFEVYMQVYFHANTNYACYSERVKEKSGIQWLFSNTYNTRFDIPSTFQ